MYIRLSLLFLLVLVFSCSKEDESGDIPLTISDSNLFVGRILPDNDGYWLINRTAEATNCYTCSSINFIDGITYFTNDKSYKKDAVGYILDAEVKNNNLLVVTSSSITKFNHNLQNTIIKSASSDENFKLITKDANDKIWILSNKSISSIEGDDIPFPNNITAIDFETAKDNYFWIASADTVYQIKQGSVKKYNISQISGNNTSTSAIYNLKITKNCEIWVNTSQKVFKLDDLTWKDTPTGTFYSDNFKTIPFMDVDASGNLWLAEKHYQAFTTLHCFNGTNWTSYKIEPKIESWITDIEVAEPGSVWIGTMTGLRKMSLN